MRGFQTEDDAEMSELYFNNPSKGGGPIESSHWDEQDKVLYITFENASGRSI